MSDKQEFEKYPALTEIIQHFASHVPVRLDEWSTLLAEINAALQAASQPPAVRGAVWVQDELPHYGRMVLVEYHDGSFGKTCLLPNISDDFWGRTVKRWLDESPTAAGDGKEAIEFSEWIEENRITRDIDGAWIYQEIGATYVKAFTTAQLYDIFKQQNK
jgi:hypothetical protein